MSRRFYTIFILPNAQARFRKIHVSRNFLVAVAVLASLLVGLSVLAPHLLLRARAQAERLAFLQAENQKLRQDNARFEASLSRIGDQVAAIESAAGRIAKVVGMDKLPFIRPTGGSTTALPPDATERAMLEEELASLRQRTDSLDDSISEIHAAVEARLRQLASTPSIRPVDGWFSDSYGWRSDPFDGSREFHRGLDIVVPHGTPVRASADGLVTVAGRQAGYGKVVHLSHGSGLSTRYGHLSEILVRPGQRVKQGDVVGRVGSTGRSTGPHLHYEVLRAGRQVNPRKYLDVPAFGG